MIKDLVHPWMAGVASCASEHDARDRRPVWKDVRSALLVPEGTPSEGPARVAGTLPGVPPHLAHAYELV